MDHNPYQLNTWLDPLIQNYEHYFGKTDHPVVWEVGSRDGKDGDEIARRIYSGHPDWFWTKAEITAVEANPEQVKVIKKNFPEMEVIGKAVSNFVGAAPFEVYEGDEGAVGSSSLNLGWKEHDLPFHQIQVEVDRLENLIKDEEIDIMKIDCEGSSVEVMEGMGDKVRRVKVYHIETEKWTDSNIKMKPFMSNHGYILVDDTEQYGGMPDQVWVRQ